MYQPKPSARDRIATIAAVLAIHLGLAFALVNLSGPVREALPQDVVDIFDVTEPPSPPPIVEEIPDPAETRPEREEGAASAKNIESKATPVVAPKPPISLPIPVPIPVAKTPGQGSESTQGASDVVGSGTGAGGQGTGIGSGGAGSGTGGGGIGGQASRPVLISPKLTTGNYPRDVSRLWPRGGSVAIAFRVQLDGRVTDCKVNRSSGVPVLDQWTCRLAETRLRFRPAKDDQGRPYVTWYGYIQGDTGRFER